MWHKGQKIVCINGKFPLQFYEWGDHVPTENEIYTIRKIAHGAHGVTGQISLSFLLEEIVNPTPTSGAEVMFSAHRFRPYTEKIAESRSHSEVLVKTSEKVLQEA